MALGPREEKDESLPFLVQIHGSELGSRLHLHGRENSFGRHEGCTFVLASDSVSRRHCSISREGEELLLRDWGSTNGTFLNGRRLAPEERARIRAGDRIQLGELVYKVLRAGDVEAAYHEELRRMAVTDGLTEAYNKRYLLEHLEREVSRCLRHRRPLALLLFDIDHFKRLNDEYGHLVGDRVLKSLCGRIRQSFLRQEDLLARFGGEEFAVVLPETDREQAGQAAERLRFLVASEPFPEGEDALAVTISVGGSCVGEGMTGMEALLSAADENLYRAKREGRNRVVI